MRKARVRAVTLVAAAATYRISRQEIDALADYHLRQTALSLSDRALARAGGGGGDLVIQLWDEDGGRLYVSRPGAGLPPVADLGFATIRTPSAVTTSAAPTPALDSSTRSVPDSTRP